MQAKDAKVIVEQMQAESQATKERRQETRETANTLLTTLEELEMLQYPVQQAAIQIRKIQEDVHKSSETLKAAIFMKSLEGKAKNICDV